MHTAVDVFVGVTVVVVVDGVNVVVVDVPVVGGGRVGIVVDVIAVVIFLSSLVVLLLLAVVWPLWLLPFQSLLMRTRLLLLLR